MTPLLLVAALLSTATPARVLDTTWGVLTRSTHLHGRWRIALDDGTSLTGDWIVANREVYRARDFGGGGGPAKAIYLLSSTSKTVCAFDADEPYYLYCTDGLARNVHVPGKAIAFGRATTPLDDGSLELDVKPTAPTLAEEEMLFERTIGAPLAKALGATSITRDKGGLVVVVPFRDVTAVAGSERHASGSVLYAQDIVDAEATIRIGPAPATISIRARETARYVEDCSVWEHASMSCMPMPPTCVRRN